jgi:thiosulfate reductase cytochrome b subunit
MTLAGWIMILFWLGFLLYGVVSWAISRTFVQLQDIERIELDELDRDNIN